MLASSILSVFVILGAILMVVLYALQIIELAEKRIVRVANWIKRSKLKRKQAGIPPTEVSQPVGQQDSTSE